MTQEEQRIAIAKAHGWKIIEDEHFKFLHGPHHPPEIGLACGKHLTEYECFRAFFDSDETESIPDYLHDLNAIREAEEALEPDQQKLYILFLCEGIVNPTNPMDLFYLKHKSAAECSRALLRALGLWKD